MTDSYLERFDPTVKINRLEAEVARLTALYENVKTELRNRTILKDAEIARLEGELAAYKTASAWIGELAKKIKLPPISVDDFDGLMGDIACSSAHYFAGLFLSFAKIDEIADGQYEDMKDATYALARLVARELGYPLADMDKTYMHVIEKDLAAFDTPVCPNECEHVKTCAEKPKFHHIKNKIECVIWHMKMTSK